MEEIIKGVLYKHNLSNIFGIFRGGSVPKCHKGGPDMKAKRNKRMGKWWMVSLVFILGLAMLSTFAYGSGFELHEQGTKAVAMGGAFTAQADDPSAVFATRQGSRSLKELRSPWAFQSFDLMSSFRAMEIRPWEVFRAT